MTAQWYCINCQTYIESDEIDDHEERDHTVKGMIRPNRLLGNDPFKLRIESNGKIATESGIVGDGEIGGNGTDADGNGGDR